MIPFFGATDIETLLNNLSLTVTTVGAALVVVLLLLAVGLQKRVPKLKLPLFMAIVVVVAGTTLTIGGGTIYLNVASATGGPVHWHADFEIWACGNQINLRDPVGLNNKIGTPSLHEHNDNRIHLEGVPINLPYDFSIGKFMAVVGGGISKNSLSIPLTGGNYFIGDAPNPDDIQPYIHTDADGKIATFASGESCGGQPAQVQLFAYQYNDATKTYTQTKIADPANYSPRHDENIPPGDCVIIEFAPSAATTDKTCRGMQ